MLNVRKLKKLELDVFSSCFWAVIGTRVNQVNFPNVIVFLNR